MEHLIEFSLFTSLDKEAPFYFYFVFSEKNVKADIFFYFNFLDVCLKKIWRLFRIETAAMLNGNPSPVAPLNELVSVF